MAFHAVYLRHTPFAIEQASFPVINGSVRLQKVGDVLLYAYLSCDDAQVFVDSVTMYIGGQEIDTWDSYYLNTLHPVLQSHYNGYSPDRMVYFLPLPIPPLLPVKNMKYHEIDFAVRTSQKLTLNVVFALVDEDIPDVDILYTKIVKHSIRPHVPFSLYGAVKYMACSDVRLDSIRFEREYTIPPVGTVFSYHTSTRTRQYIDIKSSFDIGMTVIYADSMNFESINLFGYIGAEFVYGVFSIETQKLRSTQSLGALTVLKVVSRYIITQQSVYSFTDGILQHIQTYDDTIIDAFIVSGRLFLLFKMAGFAVDGEPTIRSYTQGGLERFSAQVIGTYIVVYSLDSFECIDSRTLSTSGYPPTNEIYMITSSTQRDPLDTYEAGKLDGYTVREDGLVSVIYYNGMEIHRCRSAGYRTYILDPQEVYIYFFSVATSEVVRIPNAIDGVRIRTLIPFCLDTNSTGLSGYRWFDGEDIRIDATGTLYACMYTVLSVRKGMASLRF